MDLVLNASASTVIYTLSLHDALPIFAFDTRPEGQADIYVIASNGGVPRRSEEHTSSSHPSNSYAVFCLKKKIIHHTTSSPAIAEPCAMHPPAETKREIRRPHL